MTKQVRVGVGVMLINKKGEILLGKKYSESKFASGEVWSMLGGGLEFGENLTECAIREVKEETNLNVSSVETFCFNNEKTEVAQFITIGLKSTSFSGELKTMEPDVIGDWTWFSLDKLPEPLFVPSQTMINCYKRGKFHLID